MHNKRDAGLDECTAGGVTGHEECTTEGMQDIARQEG